MGYLDYLTEKIEYRDEQRKSAQNPCSTCPINKSHFDYLNSLITPICDFFILLASKVESNPFRPVSTKFAIQDMIETHESCELTHYRNRAECMKCPLGQVLHKSSPMGTNATTMTICEVFEELQPRSGVKRSTFAEELANSTVREIKWQSEDEKRF